MSCSAFGVSTTFGLTVPDDLIVDEATLEETVEIDEIMGPDSEYARACPLPYGERTVTVRGRGDMVHATLTASIMNEGDLVVTSRKRTESNTAEPRFEIVARAFFTRGTPILTPP
jgi:hypothetical protein